MFTLIPLIRPTCRLVGHVAAYHLFFLIWSHCEKTAPRCNAAATMYDDARRFSTTAAWAGFDTMQKTQGGFQPAATACNSDYGDGKFLRQERFCSSVYLVSEHINRYVVFRQL